MSNQSQLEKRRSFYFYGNHFKLLSRLIKRSSRESFTDEKLNALSVSLLDGTVFDIVNNLSELQQLSEKNLFEERQKMVKEYTNQRTHLLKRHKNTEKACETRPHHFTIVQTANKRELDAFDKRMNEDLHRFDLKIINEMDKKVTEQQETLQKAGVLCFFPSKDPQEVKVQMKLLNLIQNLSKKQSFE